VISSRKQEALNWCGCIGKVVLPREAKAQQGSTQSGEPESAAKEKGTSGEHSKF